MTDKIMYTRNSSEHEEDIYRLAEELKIQLRDILDFSTSVNPLGVSKKIKSEIRKNLKYIHHYPDPETRRIRKRFAQYNGINPETVLCGNGSTELIYLITRALKPQKILIPAPTYSEYERACKTGYELRVISYKLKKEDNFKIKPEEFIAAMQGKQNSQSLTPGSELSGAPCDMTFLCNPNNPTGRLVKKEGVKKVADVAKELKCYLVVDEAFIDFCPEDSVIKDVADNPYLIVLRTMTNFYALAGLRIGYGVFPPDLIGRIKGYKEPWTVSSIAQKAAVAALRDKIYRKETFALIHQEKRFFEKSFRKLEIEFFPSDANFYLLKITNEHEIFNQLKRTGILVKECSHFRGLDSTYLRVAVKSHKENAILIKELAAILQPPIFPGKRRIRELAG